jgi:hypothetical protein
MLGTKLDMILESIDVGNQAPCSQRKDQDQDQVILILFSLFYITNIDRILLKLNGT